MGPVFVSLGSWFFHEFVPGESSLPCGSQLIAGNSHRVFRPIDPDSLKLQSHGKVPVRKWLTVHNASECSEITQE